MKIYIFYITLAILAGFALIGIGELLPPLWQIPAAYLVGLAMGATKPQ